MTRSAQPVWRAAQAMAALLVLGLFLFSVRDLLNPFLLFWILVVVLLPFRDVQGRAGAWAPNRGGRDPYALLAAGRDRFLAGTVRPRLRPRVRAGPVGGSPRASGHRPHIVHRDPVASPSWVRRGTHAVRRSCAHRAGGSAHRGGSHAAGTGGWMGQRSPGAHRPRQYPRAGRGVPPGSADPRPGAGSRLPADEALDPGEWGVGERAGSRPRTRLGRHAGRLRLPHPRAHLTICFGTTTRSSLVCACSFPAPARRPL